VQFHSLRNYYPRGHAGRLAITAALSAAWYGMWIVGSVFAAFALAHVESRDRLHSMVGWGLVGAGLYWQLVPVLMASAGATLDLKRLLVYPIPSRHLFRMEVLLRLSTGFEMTLVLIGAAAGLLASSMASRWAPLGLLLFALMNLLLATGIRQILGRIFARRHVREAAILLLVLAVAAPRLLVARGGPEPLAAAATWLLHPVLPFGATTNALLGENSLIGWAVLLIWTLLAYAFGRWQFESGLRFDSAEAESSGGGFRFPWLEGLYRLPSRLFRDPLAALIEKEIRFLSRTPRFRLVFVMGFSFGLLVWLPLAYQRTAGVSDVGNYLTYISAYSLLLLSEVAFWNNFGFDRAAAQLYFSSPTPLRTVIRAKNITALLAVILEVTLIAAVWFVVGMPITAGKLLETYLVTLVLAVLMLAAGNLGSVRYPRPVDPRQSWRTSSAGRLQALLLLLCPVIAAPVVLAYLARYAFSSQIAFYGTLVFDGVVAGVFYWVALDSAVETVEENRESLLATLSERQGPVTT